MTMVVGLPGRFRDARWGQLPEGPLKAAVRRYLENYRDASAKGIAPAFLGRARTWKTYAASVIATVIADRGGVDTQFVAVPEQLATLEMSRFADTTTAMLQRWKTAPFLVMDDFTEPPATSFYAQTVLPSVITARFNAQLPTLWTGNIVLERGAEAEALMMRFGAVCARRLLDGSKGYRVVL